MKVLVTGAYGFIGKNLCAHLEQLDGISVLKFGKENTNEELRALIDEADFIYHTAGVNRPKDPAEFVEGNIELTQHIIDFLTEAKKKTPILITSSIQAEMDNPYGHSKSAAENIVFDWHLKTQTPVYVYRLPGVFGKWAQPNYNSVVATWCYNIARDLPVQISDPNHTVSLVYIDDVIKQFLGHLKNSSSDIDYTQYQSVSPVFEVTLKELNVRLNSIRDVRQSLVLPNLDDQLNKYLYSTYVSYLDTDNFSYSLNKNTDDRGWLSEFIKSKQFGQVFISKTKPGISRGDHWHHTKIEKFLVVEGDAEITFRNIIDNQDIILYKVSGDDAKVLDIPVGYVHAIKNTGSSDLITLFWANEILDKNAPDTFYEKVEARK